MRPSALLCLAFAGCIAASQLPLQTVNHVKTQEEDNISSYLAYLGDRFHLPGISVAVVRLSPDGESVAEAFYNWGNSSESGRPSASDTLYSIASNSKAFTATSLGLVISDYAEDRNSTPLPQGLDRIGWETPVSKIMDEEEWALMDEYAGKHVQLRDLVSHATGMPRHDLAYSPRMNLKQLVQSLRDLRPTFELREQWQYNNMMYATSAYIVSRLTNTTYESFVHSRIFSSLNMGSSTYSPEQANATGRLAENWVYSAGPGGNLTRRVPYFLRDWSERSVGVNAGAGGVITCTRDLVQWVSTLLNNGKHPGSGKQVIPKSVIEQTMAGRTVVEPKPAYPELSGKVYAAGWWRYSYSGHQIVQHSGNVPGFTSRISLLRDAGLGIISLTNGDMKDPALESLHYRVMEDAFGFEHIDWPTRFEEKSKQAAEARQVLQLQEQEQAREETTLDLTKYLGTYAAPGYFENFTLCAYPASTSPACKSVFSAYSATYGSTFSSERSHALYAYWPTLWSTHFRLLPHPTEKETFKLYIDTLYPEGAGKDKSPFFFRWEMKESRAEFEVDQDGEVGGVGLWDIEAGPRERVVGKPRESSEAFFKKIV